MKNAMLELQMAIPSLKADSALTLTLKNDDAVIMAVEAALNLPETTSVQKVTLIYGKRQPDYDNPEIMKMYVQINISYSYVFQISFFVPLLDCL